MHYSQSEKYEMIQLVEQRGLDYNYIHYHILFYNQKIKNPLFIRVYKVLYKNK